MKAAVDAPFIPIDGLTPGGQLLILTPHPDDESLGSGAAIAAASEAGCQVIVAALTDGGQSHPGSASYPPSRLAALRWEELKTAVSTLTGGAGKVIALEYPDQGMTEADMFSATHRLSALVAGHSITTVWTSWQGDPHPDHQRAAKLCKSVVRLHPSVCLWQFPVWGRFTNQPLGPGEVLHRFEPDIFRSRKAAAIAAHRSQMTGYIQDAPAGFMMTPRMRRHFIETPELFISSQNND